MHGEVPDRSVPATESLQTLEAAETPKAPEVPEGGQPGQEEPAAPLTVAQAQAVEDLLEGSLARMIDHQQRRVLRLAQELNPRLTSEDVLQPHDYPDLRGSAPWNYEDGVLAGLMAAQIAMRAALRQGACRPSDG